MELILETQSHTRDGFCFLTANNAVTI